MDGSLPYQAPSLQSRAPLYWLALGTFAVGTESFMVAGILPKIAGDLAVSPSAAGQLVTAFALSYALSSPILTALSAGVRRRRLMIGAMVAFTLANLVAAAATGYWTLMAARVLLACAAGIYVPGANALAGALVPPEKRGSAIAIINGGLTVAIAFGVPIGTFVATHFGWRMTFGGVAMLAAVAVAGLAVGLHKDIGANLPTATLRQRLDVARRPSVLLALLVTTLWATGAYTVYTYLALFLAAATTIEAAHVGLVLFLWGVSAGVGVFLGGAANDRFGPRKVIFPGLIIGALAFVVLSTMAHFVSAQMATVPVLIAIIAWGISHWAFYPAQQVRLIGIAGVSLAPIALSLNASFMYLGFSIGAASGSLTLLYSHAGNLGWVAAAFEAIAIALMLVTGRRPFPSLALQQELA